MFTVLTTCKYHRINFNKSAYGCVPGDRHKPRCRFAPALIKNNRAEPGLPQEIHIRPGQQSGRDFEKIVKNALNQFQIVSVV